MGKRKHSIEEDHLDEEIDEEDIDEEDLKDAEVIDEDSEKVVLEPVGKDLSDVSYEDFNKVTEVEDDEEENNDTLVATEEKAAHSTQTTTKTTTTTTTTKHHVEVESTNDSFEDRITENEGLMVILDIFWTWVRRLGVVIMIVLSAYYITQGMFKDLFLYLLMLVVAYFFGYGFMFVLTKLRENR